MPLNNGMYRAITDKIALQQLTIPAYIPNPNLGIETAEQTQPFGLSYIRMTPNRRSSAVIPNPLSVPIEEAAANFQGNPVKAGDFPADFYLGNPIGGF